MDKLELKHLAAYLPYKLQWCFEGEDFSHEVIGFELNTVHLLSPYNDYGRCTIYEGKPILRPLSDLTKEIEHNGEILVFSDVYLSNSKIEMLLDQSLCLFNNPLNSLDYNSINLLLKYHFDIFGLIDAGLAIDINTLKNEK